jgi:radical SAM superfamily enzyme YgiQ (UPF0313 family)
MILNICLVRPNFQEPTTVYPPLGLLTIAPYFDKKHMISFADQQVGGTGFLGSYFDIVVFSAFTVQLPLVEKLICQGKEFGVKSKFVVGGPGVTSNPNYAKSLVPSADLLFAGDGEYFAESLDCFSDVIASQVSGCADYRRIPYHLSNKKIPDWNLIKYEQYIHTTGLGVETSRGCPFNCVMCTAHMIHGKQWEPRKPSDVVEELKFLSKKYGCKKFYFADDNATVDPSRWVNLMLDITSAKLGLSLSVPEGIQAHHLDYETLGYMQEAGLNRFTIGAESGNQRVLDKVINKGGLTVEKIEEVVRNAVKLGMKPSCFFVIGFIGETLEEANQTVEFAEKLRHLGAENCTVRNAIPMPGTRLFNMAKEEGYLIVPEEQLFDFNFVHKSKHLLITSEWSPEQIDALVSKAQQQERTHIIHSNMFKHPRATLKFMLKP